MKVLSLTVKNIGIVADAKIELNKPLIIFYGEIRQGKTTLLNAVRWVCGGAFPTDIIRHGEKEAFVELDFDGGCIRREWYVSKKDQVTKAREIEFVRNGKPVSNPASEIRRLLNPFLLNQDHLRNMGEADRKKFFAEMFAVDTTELDKQLFDAEHKASDLRAEIKGFGEIEPVKVEPVDVAAVKAERAHIVEEHNQNVQRWNTTLQETKSAHRRQREAVEAENEKFRKHNYDVSAVKDESARTCSEIATLEQKLLELKKLKAGQDAWINANPERKLTPLPAEPDTSELDAKVRTQPDTAALDAKLSEAAAVQVRVEQYNRDTARLEQKRTKEKELDAHEARIRSLRKDKIAKLKGASETCGIKGLAFDEDGSFSYEGTSAGMLSTSQIMRLSSEISGLYPEGFGIELLDRGESLGRAIFEYIELAKREEKTILATIVGQRPASTPPEVGVFVVSDGKVITDVQPETEQPTLV